MMSYSVSQPLATSTLTLQKGSAFLAAFLLAAVVVPQDALGQTTIFDEPFDDESQFTVTRGETDQNGDDNYFILAQNASPSITESYTNSGTNFLAGQDTDDADVANGVDAPQITWSGIDISGEGGLRFSGSFGANGTSYEESDFLRIEYRIDDSEWQKLLVFRGDPNDDLSEDTDFDGVGDGALVNDGSLTSFSKDIGGTGSTLGLRFTALMSAGGEDFAVDDFKVESATAVQFTASSGSVSEDEGSTSLTIQISEPSGSGDEDVTVEFEGANSDADQADFSSDFPGTNTTTTVNFSSASDGDTGTVTLNLTDDGEEGAESARFNLTSPSGGLELHPSTQFNLTIQDGVNDHSGDVLITELMPDPDDVGDSEGEYVELYNATNTSKSIDGWKIDESGISGVTIPVRGFVVLCRDSDASANGGIDCDGEVSFVLSNGGEGLELLDSNGTQVDTVNYGGGNFPSVPTGSSLILTGSSDNNDGSNWTTTSRRERGFALDQSGDDGSPGRNGTDQTLQPSTEITGAAGWRMLGAPMGGVNADTLAQVSLVQGMSGHFPGNDPNLYQWPGGTDGGTDWATPSATEDLTGSGAPAGGAGGFIWYVFDTAETEFTDTPPFTLSLPGPPRTSSVATGSLGEGFHLLGNPYAQSFDVSALNLSAQNFQTTVQVWDPSAGSYKQVMQSSTSEDFIGPYQGFFTECVSGNGCSGNALTFDSGGRRADSIGLKSVEEGPPHLEFRLVGKDGEGAVLTRDEALTLHAPEGATLGWDVHDASKLTPLSGRYATAAFRGVVDGETRLQAVASIPPALPEEGVELPVSLQLQGTDPIETFRLTWPTWENVPEHWGLALHDAVADSTVNLRTHSSYTFAPQTSKAQSVPPPRSPMELPDQIRAKAQSDSARFTLTVQPSSIPVELAAFDATVSEKAAELRWTTASETNNAGFHVEHRGPEADGFSSTGFVEGHGTTDQSQQYRFRTDPLEPGRHVFRLRQVDLDGTATRSDTVSVQVRLAEAARVELAPNPVRTRATVSLRVRDEQAVRVALYDMLGRRVRILHDGPLAPDHVHTLRIRADELSSGLYLLRAEGERFRKTRRVTVVR